MGILTKLRSRISGAFLYKGYRIPLRLVELTGGGPDTFGIISEQHIRLINSVFQLRQDLKVFELGCGIGRDAIPLTEILSSEGSYVGTDIISDSIDWCKQNISTRHPNFAFIHQDIRDELHNPNGRITQKMSLPVQDSSVDLVIAQSVFTHMLHDNVSHYLMEVQRMLRPDGLAYVTCFVVDDRLLDLIRVSSPTQWKLTFKHYLADGCFANDPRHPTGAVAYREETLRQMATTAALRLVELKRGSWSGFYEDPFNGQDVMLLRKSSSDTPRHVTR